ncbi:MAG: PAS domain-containing protein [Planctomycetota bacterium]
MKPTSSSLSLPVRMALPVVAIGVLCTVALGVAEYAKAVRAEGRSLERFVEAAGHAVSSSALNLHEEPDAAAARIASGLRGLEGCEAVTAWRVLASDGGEELIRSPAASAFNFESAAALDQAVVWTPGPGAERILQESALRDHLVIRLPFESDQGQTHLFVAAIDGPSRHRDALRQIAQRLLPTAAGYVILSLVVFALAYRWVSRPLATLHASLVKDEPSTEPADPDHHLGPVNLTGPIGVAHRHMHDLRAEAQARVLATQAMAEASSQALLMIDRQGEIQNANRATVRLLGAERVGDIVGRSLAEFFGGCGLGDFEALLQPDTLKADATSTIPVRLKPRATAEDTTTTTVGLSVGAFDPQTQRAAVVLQPRTRGDALQDRLAQQQRLLQAAVDHQPQPWALTDDQGRVLIVNRAWIGQTRQTADSVIQSDLTDPTAWAAWGADMGGRASEIVAETLRHGVTCEHTVSLRTPDGSQVLEARPCVSQQNSSGPAAKGYVWTIRHESSPMAEDIDDASPSAPASDAVYSDLREARTTQHLMDATVEAIRQLAGTPAAGIAVRAANPTGQRRSDQRLAVGSTSLPLRAYAGLRDVAESDLMPSAMNAAGPAVRFSEFDATSEWAEALRACGLGASVALKLPGLGEQLGVIWVAERPGASIGAGRVESLHRAAELVGARLDALRLSESFQTLGLLDGATGLPTTPALLRHMQTVPVPSDFTTPNHLLVFTLDPETTSTRASQREAFAAMAADCLRARCRRNVFIAATGPAEFAVAVHAMGTSHAESLGKRLLGALRELPLADRSVGDRLMVGREKLSTCDEEADARLILNAAREAALADRHPRRAAS